MFITTANVIHTIPPALQDRMEIIRLPGYLEVEKVKIAQKHLLPKMLPRHGLRPSNVQISEAAMRRIIQGYTREAGVRNLERELAKIMRKVARNVATSGRSNTIKVSSKNLAKYLGVTHHTDKELPGRSLVGVVTGLAWTSVGGDILRIEATFMPGTGRLTLTGQLGDVMQESAQIALSHARNMARVLPLKKNFYNEIDVHIHVPEGAIPKDGPSAGVAIATALVSNFFGIPVRRDVAMTGELTLKGEVLPVGGLNEKSVAALRAGVKEIVIPKGSAAVIKELPKEVRTGLKIHTAETLKDVLKVVLEQPLPRASRRSVKATLDKERPGYFEFIESSARH
jgi:ATP-dependent Lon protease